MKYTTKGFRLLQTIVTSREKETAKAKMVGGDEE